MNSMYSGQTKKYFANTFYELIRGAIFFYGSSNSSRVLGHKQFCNLTAAYNNNCNHSIKANKKLLISQLIWLIRGESVKQKTTTYLFKPVLLTPCETGAHIHPSAPTPTPSPSTDILPSKQDLVGYIIIKRVSPRFDRFRAFSTSFANTRVLSDVVACWEMLNYSFVRGRSFGFCSFTSKHEIQ